MINLPQVSLSTLEDPNTLEAIKSILDYLKKSKEQSGSSTFASGMVMFWPKAEPPSGWLIYTDAPLPRSDYPNLFSIFGSSYSQAGDSGATFRLPPGCGRALVIAGAGSGLTSRSFGAVGGEESHTLTTTEMPSHTHGPGAGTNFVTQAGGGGVVGAGAALGIQAATSSTGGGGAHNNMQPFTTWYAIIKT